MGVSFFGDAPQKTTTHIFWCERAACMSNLQHLAHVKACAHSSRAHVFDMLLCMETHPVQTTRRTLLAEGPSPDFVEPKELGCKSNMPLVCLARQPGYAEAEQNLPLEALGEDFADKIFEQAGACSPMLLGWQTVRLFFFFFWGGGGIYSCPLSLAMSLAARCATYALRAEGTSSHFRRLAGKLAGT